MGSSSMIEIGGGPGLLLRLIGTNFWEVSTSTEMMMMMMMMVSTSNLKLLKTNTEKILPKNPWFQCSFLQVKLGPKLRVFGTCKDKIPPKRLLLETPVFHPPIFFRTHVHMGFDHWVTMSVWNHFETFWRLSWRRPNEDQVKTANFVNVVTSLANEDLMKTWLMKWRSHEVKTWIISDKISIKYLI